MTHKRERALVALMNNSTMEGAARDAGITSKTLRKYLNEPEFQQRYKDAFAGLVDDATRAAQGNMTPAIAVLNEVMLDKSQNGQTRVFAARSILEFSLKLTELTDISKLLRGDSDVL